MSLLSRPYGYSKMDKEDPEELKHRRAQFLIYKALEKADSRTRPSCLRVRICKLKIKIGKRLTRLRKSMVITISSASDAAKGSLYKQVLSQMKAWKRLFRGTGQAIGSLPPAFN